MKKDLVPKFRMLFFKYNSKIFLFFILFAFFLMFFDVAAATEVTYVFFQAGGF